MHVSLYALKIILLYLLTAVFPNLVSKNLKSNSGHIDASEGEKIILVIAAKKTKDTQRSASFRLLRNPPLGRMLLMPGDPGKAKKQTIPKTYKE